MSDAKDKNIAEHDTSEANVSPQFILNDAIVQAIHSFVDTLIEENSSDENMSKAIILRGLMYDHWVSLFTVDLQDHQTLTQSLFTEFERSSLNKNWFKEIQMHILDCLMKNHEAIITKRLCPTLLLRKACHDLHNLQHLILNDIAAFYSLSSARRIENLVNDKVYLVSVLRENILNVISGIALSGNDLTDTTNRVLNSSKSTYSKALAMVSMSEKFSQNVSSVSVATQNLSTSIDEIATQLSKGAIMTRKSAAEAKKAQEVVQSLSSAAHKIGEVVKIINEIANQTNLLALNATIEAARAGSAGKGFSVVASEVKNLAGQTAKATDEITTQIKEMQDATDKVVTSIKEMTTTIGDINDGTTIISSAVNEQGAATQEIFRSIAHVATSSVNFINLINQLKQFTGDTSNATQETLNIAVKVTDQSQYLKEALQQIVDFVSAT